MNTKVTYSFHTFYRKLNLLSCTHQFSISQPTTLSVSLSAYKIFNWSTRSRLLLTLKQYTEFIIDLAPVTKIPVYRSALYWYKPEVIRTGLNRVPNNLNYVKFEASVNDFDYSHRAWIVGHKKLSFYIKKTITYEKNRKVKKAKLFLQFSKLYNFFKNMVNVFFKQDKLSKKYIYMYFLKKQYKLSVYNVFKGLAQKLTNQKKKPLILNVPHRK